MSGRFGGLRAFVQGVAVNAKWTHSLIHRDSSVATLTTASRQLSGDLNGVLEVVVKTMNFIKARPLKAQLSNVFATNSGADHNN